MKIEFVLSQSLTLVLCVAHGDEHKQGSEQCLLLLQRCNIGDINLMHWSCFIKIQLLFNSPQIQ